MLGLLTFRFWLLQTDEYDVLLEIFRHVLVLGIGWTKNQNEL